MKNYKVVNKFRFSVAIIILLVILITTVFTLINALSEDELIVDHYDKYIVSSGDTIYHIANNHNYSNMDLNRFIYEIEQASECDAMIYPGDILNIPVYA